MDFSPVFGARPAFKPPPASNGGVCGAHPEALPRSHGAQWREAASLVPLTNFSGFCRLHCIVGLSTREGRRRAAGST